jgi:predicted methyltransferase
MGKPYLLKNDSIANINDTLIGLHEGIGKRKCLNVSVMIFDMKSPLKKSTVKKSSTTKSASAIQTITDQTYSIM